MDSELIDRLLDEAGNTLVRRAIERDDWVAETIFNIASGDKSNWTLQEWTTLTTELEQSTQKVKDWLPK